MFTFVVTQKARCTQFKPHRDVICVTYCL